MDGSLSLVTAPLLEPITLDDAKDWARVSGDAENHVIEALIVTARQHVEALTGRSLVTQTWDYFRDTFPSQIDLPRPPLVTLTSIKYIDTSGTLVTLAATEYTVDAVRHPARIVPSYGKCWPTTRCVPNAVVIRFDAGYGVAAETVPQELRHAIGVLVATLYAQREMVSEATGPQLTQVPIAFWQLVNQHRIWWL